MEGGAWATLEVGYYSQSVVLLPGGAGGRRESVNMGSSGAGGGGQEVSFEQQLMLASILSFSELVQFIFLVRTMTRANQSARLREVLCTVCVDIAQEAKVMSSSAGAFALHGGSAGGSGNSKFL